MVITNRFVIMPKRNMTASSEFCITFRQHGINTFSVADFSLNGSYRFGIFHRNVRFA